MKKSIFRFLVILTIFISGSCSNKRTVKKDLVLHFNSYAFETLKNEREFEINDSPATACNSTITFYSDSIIKLHLEIVKTKNINNASYRWLLKNENIERERIWTSYHLANNEDRYWVLSIRKNQDKQIIAVSMTGDRKKVVYFDK